MFSKKYDISPWWINKKVISKAVIKSTVIKAGLTLNDLYDTIGLTHNQFSDFHCVYIFIQVVHTEFIKILGTE